MTPEITLVLVILFTAVGLFLSNRVRVDLVALLVLVVLTLTNIITPAEAVAGFSNPAVITVWAVFIISGGLAQTGIADWLGRQMLHFAGHGEMRLILIIMLTAALLSSFMNNVGVAAMLLPVSMEIARRTRRSPSRLLIPLSFGALLGGLTTLVGTPPNILASNALREAGLEPFSLFDFTPVGLVLLLIGTLFMTLIGRHLLPQRNLIREAINPNNGDLEQTYDLGRRLFSLRIPPGGALDGVPLADSRIGSLLGLNVVAILRNGHNTLSPSGDMLLKAQDRLLVMGRSDELSSLHLRDLFTDAQQRPLLADLTASGIILAEATLLPNSPLLGQSVDSLHFRQQYNANVVALRRNGQILLRHFHTIPLRAGDTLLVQGNQAQIDALSQTGAFQVSHPTSLADYHLEDSLMFVRLPEESVLTGRTLRESRLGDAFGLTVLGIVRGEKTCLQPGPDDVLAAGDRLLLQGHARDIAIIRGLEELETLEGEISPRHLESDEVGLVEVVLSPFSTLEGRTLREIHFREKYGLNVLAIWRRGRPYRHNLRDMSLQLGDALLLHGVRQKINLLGKEPDFVVLRTESQPPLRLAKAPFALIGLLMMLVPVMADWLPIYLAAIMGALFMLLTGCLNMDEAYRFIEWKAVFLIAGMLSLGTAMQNSGTAHFLASQVVSALGNVGPTAVLIGLFLLTNLGAQMMPSAVVTVLMAPIAINTAQDLLLSPYPFVMIVAIAASSSFLSPIGHPANVLIMGPGGYKFSNYIKVGLPLVLLILITAVLLVPRFWHFEAVAAQF